MNSCPKSFCIHDNFLFFNLADFMLKINMLLPIQVNIIARFCFKREKNCNWCLYLTKSVDVEQARTGLRKWA